jgi:hypothetical protein
MDPAHLQDLHAERLKSGEKPVQRRLISKRAVQHSFHRLDGGREPLEVKQGFGRQDPYYADLVVGRRHENPQQVGTGNGTSPRCLLPACGTPLTTGEFGHPGEIRAG